MSLASGRTEELFWLTAICQWSSCFISSALDDILVKAHKSNDFPPIEWPLGVERLGKFNQRKWIMALAVSVLTWIHSIWCLSRISHYTCSLCCPPPALRGTLQICMAAARACPSIPPSDTGPSIRPTLVGLGSDGGWGFELDLTDEIQQNTSYREYSLTAVLNQSPTHYAGQGCMNARENRSINVCCVWCTLLRILTRCLTTARAETRVMFYFWLWNWKGIAIVSDILAEREN